MRSERASVTGWVRHPIGPSPVTTPGRWSVRHRHQRVRAAEMLHPIAHRTAFLWKVDGEKWWRNQQTSRSSRGQRFRAGGSTAAFTSSFCCFQYRLDPRRGQMLFQQQPNENIKKHERISSNCCAAVSPSYLSDGVKQVTSWRPQQKSIFIKSLHDSFKVYL